jgi:uncharacterized RDD family membrane protein YckC
VDDAHTAAEHVRPVGVGPRAVATVIDWIVLTVVFGVPALALFGHSTTTPAGGHTRSYSAHGSRPFLVWAPLVLAYYTVLEATLGATAGKLILNLRVRLPDGAPIGWRQALLRNVARIVDTFPYALPYLVGAVAVWSGSDAARR